MNSNASQGARGARKAASNSNANSVSGSTSVNASSGGSAGRSDYGQAAQQGMGGEAAPGRYVNGGNDPRAFMNLASQNLSPYQTNPDTHQFAGYGPTIDQQGQLGSLYTLVPARPPVRVPNHHQQQQQQQQQQTYAPTPAGGYAANAGPQNYPQNPGIAANGQDVNGSNTPYGDTYRYATQPPQPPHQTQPRQARQEDYYRRQQDPSSRGGRRPGY